VGVKILLKDIEKVQTEWPSAAKIKKWQQPHSMNKVILINEVKELF
jgi:hypothetical protein